ncbi:hypothetical protein PHET_05009 [Paragonimus heterotremus]|uniref:Coiled-coil domain-containing protein n=1 Tax=Paragonimus heterotremus TaxID=100268 RepID=A0A8J4SPZ1_9TREM|nr:hypothetical protein PHET_05009 [Paragonimus heterotremus]
MPKKLGTCPKALEARERRAEKKKEEREKKERELEEEYWKDDDKHVTKKLQRKVGSVFICIQIKQDEKGDKRQEQLDKKKELKRMYLEELMESNNVKKAAGTSQPSKVTQAQIAAARDKLTAQLAELDRKASKKQTEELKIESNPNRIECDGEEARTVQEAIAILTVGDGNATDLDHHPERRLKAAYIAYEQKMMPIMREENPGLRTSQLKQMIYKKFQTAPENPKNQPHSSYNLV